MVRSTVVPASLFLIMACVADSTRPPTPQEASLAQVEATAKATTIKLLTTIDDAYAGTQIHSDGAAYAHGACGVTNLRDGTSNSLVTDAKWNRRLGCAARFLTVQMPSWSSPAPANAMYFPDLTTSPTGTSRAQINLGRPDCLLLRFGWTANDGADPVSFTYDGGSNSWTVTSSGRGTCWIGDNRGGQYPTGENAVVPFRVITAVTP